MGMGLRFPAWGPLEHVDTVGLELCLSVQENVLPSLFNEAHPPPVLRHMLAEGSSGAKAGKGFYDWTARSHGDLVAERDEARTACWRPSWRVGGILPSISTAAAPAHTVRCTFIALP